VEGAEDVEDLHVHVVVAARLRDEGRARGEGGDGVVIGPREEYRDPDAQGEGGVAASPRASSDSTRS
jgi:hypothetical protein